jgi:hypothetical protein
LECEFFKFHSVDIYNFKSVICFVAFDENIAGGVIIMIDAIFMEFIGKFCELMKDIFSINKIFVYNRLFNSEIIIKFFCYKIAIC